ncbi:hypothetical protein NDU88_000613 [Pleurodeles waltl]|uniref:C-type lectin domain-containing protein n=2 Tax=Pleurodeles waltl TaxID=8319 RepID=A0AAV7P4P4_PLEWA|nr:hypothetical protein NDU88_000613 [Pleurodeles waltl]
MEGRCRGSRNMQEGPLWFCCLYGLPLVLVSFLKLSEIIALVSFVKPACESNHTRADIKELLGSTTYQSQGRDHTSADEGTSTPKQCTKLLSALEEFQEDLCDRAGDTTCKLCPLHWVSERAMCYYFSEEKKNWAEGQDYCRRRKAVMVSLDDSVKKDFITNMLSTKKGYFWLGLQKQAGTWTWLTGVPLHKELFPIKDDASDQACISGKDAFSAESCFNPNKWICEKNAVEFPNIVANHAGH